SDDLQSSSNVNLNSDINENYSSKELSDKMVKAQAQLNSGNLENSLALVNEVISYNKHYHLAFQFKGVVLIEMNRKREAWDAFMESVHIGSGDVDDYLYLAEISLEFHNLMSDILAVLELK